MRRLVALGAALLISMAMVWPLAGAAQAQGLADVRLGNEAFRQGDFAVAVEHYTAAIRSGELVGEALAITYNNRGVAHGEAGDFGPAIADYSQALALRPADATTIRNLRVAHVRRGEVSFASGAYDAALADFSRAIELEPDHHLAYQRRGELLAERGLLDEAASNLEQAAMLSPGDPEIVAALDAVLARQQAVTAGAAETVPASPSATTTTAAAPAMPSEPAPAAQPATSSAEVTPPAEATDAEPVVAVRPEPAPRQPVSSQPAETPVEPEPAAAAVVTTEPAVPEPAATATATVGDAAGSEAAGGDPYRVISAVNYRAGPANDAQRLGTVDAGRIVRVTGDTLGWKHVTLPNGDRGFIYGRWLEPAGD